MIEYLKGEIKNVLRLESDEALVYYLGHSGWAIKTKSHFLIFDYFERKNKIDYKTILEGYINPCEIKDERVYVFVSHRHSDHYDRTIHQWKEKVNNITYIAGWNSRTDKFIGVPPHSDIKVGDVEILTLKSTDEGVGFLVKVDGLTIFHAGDHANWGDDPEFLYHSEIDYIAGKSNDIHIAFLPVTKYSGSRPQCMTDGAVYAIRKLNAKVTFPMHGNEKEFLYKEFAQDVKHEGFNIICAEQPGDSFRYKEKKIKKV